MNGQFSNRRSFLIGAVAAAGAGYLAHGFGTLPARAAPAPVRKEDGKLHSTELRIFSEKMRGGGDGQRPMNDARNQTMTNATVTGTAIVNGSNVMKVKFGPSQIGGSGTTYPAGESDLVLDPNVPVFKFTDTTSAAVKAGSKVRVQGVRNAEGAMVNRITAMP